MTHMFTACGPLYVYTNMVKTNGTTFNKEDVSFFANDTEVVPLLIIYYIGTFKV